MLTFRIQVTFSEKLTKITPKTDIQKFESLENVELIDNVSLFCDEMNCSILDQGHLLYWDDDHLNERGSRYFARHIVKESKFL